MNTDITRRHFLGASGAMLTLAALTPSSFAAADPVNPAKHPRKKAIMWGTVGVKGSVLEKMKAVKAAGFDGAELASHLDQAEVLKARDEVGLEIPSVCGERHWSSPLSHPDPKVRAEGLAALKQTLRDAKAYGAGSILLVPGVVNKEVSFDECWQRSIEQIRLAIPLAEELGVKISIENVWNNFITSEDQAVRYLEEINSPWVGWHFDCGNIIRYGDPIVWINTLGKRINRVHIKEYSLDRAMRNGDVWKGFGVPLLEGANNWSGIMKAFDETGYRNYLITEQGGGNTPEGLRDLRERLEKIIAS
jgi:L-ribulose-5-phosphate 3-epimerase